MPERDQKTQNATPQRLKKAREEGNYPVSKEFVSAVEFSFLIAILLATQAHWRGALMRGLRSMLRSAFATDVSAAHVRFATLEVFSSWFFPIAIAALAILSTSVIVQLAVTGFGLACVKLAPDFSRLDPISRLRDLPKRNLTSVGEAILFLSLLCYVGWKILKQWTPEFMCLPYLSLGSDCLYLGRAFENLFLLTAAIIFVWGTIDLFRQQRRYSQELKMTKQEVKEEWRQNEGSPEIKIRIRRLRHELLRRRMIAEIPKASAVIVNPTHFAVALHYEHKAMAAPRVVAKGKQVLAIRIRDIARQHQVPIIENPPLAKALYNNCEVGEEIPENLYKAVAEVLAYIFRLLNKGR